MGDQTVGCRTCTPVAGTPATGKCPPARTTEADRLLRPQPPTPIPARVQPSPVPGLLAQAVLGYRVVLK